MKADEFSRAGQRLFGLRWKSQMADAIKCNRSTVHRYATGDIPVPGWATLAIEALETRREKEKAGV